jgi:hypothetical protein
MLCGRLGGVCPVADTSPGRLKVTPAMAAGVTDKLWEIGDVVAMLEKGEAAQF